MYCSYPSKALNRLRLISIKIRIETRKRYNCKNIRYCLRLISIKIRIETLLTLNKKVLFMRLRLISIKIRIETYDLTPKQMEHYTFKINIH